MRRALLVLCGLLIFVWGLPCQAALVDEDDTYLFLDDVVVGAGGGTYDVYFVNGYNVDTLDFGDAYIAWAIEAVNYRLNTDGIMNVGPVPYTYNQYIVPNADQWPSGGNYIFYQSSSATGSWIKYGAPIGYGSPPGAGFIYADFRPNTSNVPIPGAVWLLGTGLIGLVGIRKKIRK